AFKLGCAQIDLMGLPDALVPHLNTKDADKVAVQQPDLAGEEGVTVKAVDPREGPFRGFATHPHSERPRSVSTGGGPSEPTLYPLGYGTNRRPLDRADPAKGYGALDDRRLHLGKCAVLVPPSHTISSVGSAFLRRLLTWTDDRLKLARIVVEERLE